MEPIYRRVVGPIGTAEPIPVDEQEPAAAETVAHWLITAPGFSIAWSQYHLSCVRLRDNVPGFPPPYRQFVGATHELFVGALMAPEGDAHEPVKLWAVAQLVYPTKNFVTLSPLNVVEQFEATDDEMRRLCSMLAQAVVHGVLIPETEGIIGAREAWLAVSVKTLAHMRGEEHGL